MQTFIFYLLASMVVIPAVLVVTTKNIFHSALWLIASLMSVAGVYAMLAADFLFAVQLLVYVGGIMVLLIFVVFLSGTPADWSGKQVNEKAWLAALFSFFLMAAIGSAVLGWPLITNIKEPELTTARLGDLLLTKMALPFELVSLALVAALVGAVYFSIRKPSR